ncbi:hypothetical protein [Streptosporangium sp. NPDC002721]|uniref:hypothetical protein n=1 Tax=Streptosporangium sp. NPDC002721 TaxID=3366188 RepID=UPI003687D631
MPDNGNERAPDPRVAFSDAASASTGETDERPGAADRAAVVARTDDDHLPPLADDPIDDRPLALRFTEPEE